MPGLLLKDTAHPFLLCAEVEAQLQSFGAIWRWTLGVTMLLLCCDQA